MLVAQHANVDEPLSGPKVFVIGPDYKWQYTHTFHVLRTLARGTPHETVQPHYPHFRRLKHRQPRRTFSSTPAARIRLEDDEDEEEELLKTAKSSRRPVRQQKSMRTLIMSREPKRPKPKPINPEKVREIKSKLQMLPNPRQLVKQFIACRYIDLEDQIERSHNVVQEIYRSHIEDLQSLILRSEAACWRIEHEYCKVVYHNTPRWTAAISDVKCAVTRLRYEFISAAIKDSQLSIKHMANFLQQDYLDPRQSARTKIDSLLHSATDLYQNYTLLQSLGREVNNGLTEIKDLIHSLKSADHRGKFQGFLNRFVAHKMVFKMAIHNYRSAWAEGKRSPLQVESQAWSARNLSHIIYNNEHRREPGDVVSFVIRKGILQGDQKDIKLSELVHSSFHRTEFRIARILRAKFQKKWNGALADSPKLHKVWRQLDVMAMFEMQQFMMNGLQYEVWLLMKSLEGRYGPMWSGLNPEAASKYHLQLHRLSQDLSNSRRQFALEIDLYRLINWARLGIEDRLHKLGMPNDRQERGLFTVERPISQDYARFNNWANKFAAISFRNLTLVTILQAEIRGSEDFLRDECIRLTKTYLKQPSFVPEIGTASIAKNDSQQYEEVKVKRTVFRKLFGVGETVTSGDSLFSPSYAAAKESANLSAKSENTDGSHPTEHSKDPPSASGTTNPVIVDKTTSRAGKRQSVKQREMRPVVEQFPKDSVKNSANLKPTSPKRRRSAHQYDFPHPIEQIGKESGNLKPGGTQKKPRVQQQTSQQISQPKQDQKPPVGKSTTPRPTGVEKENAAPSSTANVKLNRPTRKPHLSKRQKRSTLGPAPSSLSGRSIQGKLDLKFLGGSPASSRSYSTRTCVFEANVNESNTGYMDEQSLRVGASPKEETIQSSSTVSAHDLLLPAGGELSQSESKAKAEATSQFWSHSSKRGPSGQKLAVHYCRTLESTEEVAQLFLDSKVIGFDMEWKAQASSWDSIQNNLSLIQVANEERIALFQIALFKPGQALKDLVAPSLKKLLESPDITKCGVSIKADSTRLRKYLGVEARSIFELSHLFKLIKYGLTQPKLVNKIGVNLSNQVEEHFGLPLEKSDDVRCGDWTRPLNYRQVQYAATDPYACICLFNVMDKKRQAMDPMPPLPAHADLNLPIVLPPLAKKPLASSPVEDSDDVDIGQS
ncbi:hypothetical protein N7466_011439 [Penicillium verhagenii]|uniref:uncharacterized protein n=1 Tax=Penicillium verhagenii TaxID=1562060 RepID=UPI002544EE9A|nr:uncharacterized protein N7466_011439 [Penicillium verhagenii]KAJ5915506.1 hypothetical protein N7466_011439 [Penicillium verhagenii]